MPDESNNPSGRAPRARESVAARVCGPVARGQTPDRERTRKTAVRSGHKRELLDGVAVRRDKAGFPGDRPDDLGDVEIPARIDRETMRGAEAARRARIRSAETRNDSSVRIENAHAARQVALDLPMSERALPR